MRTEKMNMRSVLRNALFAALISPALCAPVFAQDAPEPKAGDPDFIWSQGTYVKTFIKNYDINEQKGQGTPGGYPQTVVLPGNYMSLTITKMHVYHTDDRVYGIQYEYDENTDGGKKGVLTDLIGGDAGTKSTVDLSRELPLFSVKGHYAYDYLKGRTDKPDMHYYTPILTGLTVRHYKQNPMREQIAPGLSHEDLLETEKFGDISPAEGVSPPDGIGFDVYLGQWIQAFTACTSPTDRNGRIFGLGVLVKGLNGDRDTIAKDDICQQENSGPWKSQLVGPPRIKTVDRFGNPVETDSNFDGLEYASGIYTKEKDGAKSGAGSPKLEDAALLYPQAMIAELGDTATLSFGDYPEPRLSLPFIALDSERRDPKKYAFEYGRKDGQWLGVEFEDFFFRNEDRTEKFVYLTFDPNQANANYVKGVYQEARLGDNKVAKRFVDRPKIAESQQSKSGLFEQASVTLNRNYVYTGWDWLTIDPGLERPEKGVSLKFPGRREPVFRESGDFQYYLNPDVNLAVPDGLLLVEHRMGSGSRQSITLTSEAEATDAISQSIGATVPVKGVPVGVNASRSSENSVNNSSRSMKSMAQAEYLSYSLILDKPNINISQSFARDVNRLMTSTGSDADAIAKSIVNKYGSHYAQAMTFGAVARAVSDISAKEYGQSATESYTLSATVGDPAKAGVTASQSETSKRGTKEFSEFSSSQFWTLGGGGGFSVESWSPQSDFVPVKYHLKPVYELMEPVVLSKVGEGYQTEYSVAQIKAARSALESAYNAYFDGIPRVDNRSYKPAVYRVKVENLYCHDGGDDSDEIRFKGKVDFGYRTTEDGRQLKNVIETGETYITMKCGADLTGDAKYNREFYFWTMPENVSDFSTFMCANIEETDPTAFDYDEILDDCSERAVNASLTVGDKVSGVVNMRVPKDERDENPYAPWLKGVISLERME
jgi:hypothetical protein